MSQIKLSPPCSYQGGKQRISNKIVDNMFDNSSVDENTKFYDLCCGSGSITLELINRGIHPSNITMIDSGMFGKFWNSIANGEFDIGELKKEIDRIPDVDGIQDYLKEISKNKVNHEKDVYHYLLLQSGSFGSKQVWVKDTKWITSSFRSYWKPTKTSKRRSHVNPMMPMPSTLLSRVENIESELSGSINAIHSEIDIIEWFFNENSIIYIDPPYKETTGYGYDFDYLSFVEKHKGVCDIYVSEKAAIKNSKESILLSKGRSKGGISGAKKISGNEEWLSIF